MPLLPHTHQFVEVTVSDRVFGDTVVKQKARFLKMDITQFPDSGAIEALMRVRVNLFADNAGEVGEPLTGRGFTEYDVTLVADNESAVDPTTGDVVYNKEGRSTEEWLAFLNEQAEPLMLQGDFMEYLMNNAPVEIAPMIRKFMLQANESPYNKFV